MANLLTTNSVLLAAGSANAALVTFTLYIAAVFVLAWYSNKLLKTKNFLSEYFLGSRSLGTWAFALTFAATSSSGGSFTGFPAKIYSHGWILALWIASYMVVPVCTMGLLGKRINQVARKTGAITVPDVIRDRFNSAGFGLIAMLLIVFFMSVNLVAQFKGGSLILKTLLSDVPAYQGFVASVATWMSGIELLAGVDADYFVCLLVFAVAVIVYTAYGGFHAVVWTDVMQGIVMVLGVLIMLPLALYLAGGLPAATSDMAQMVPPKKGRARLEIAKPLDHELRIPAGTWFPSDTPDGTPFYRTGKAVIVIEPGQTSWGNVEEDDRTAQRVDILEISRPTPMELKRIQAEIEAADKLEVPVKLAVLELKPYTYGADKPGVYLTGPGPTDAEEDFDGFLPFSLAISFFFMWSISGAGQPANMVRLMAFDNSRTLKRAIFTVSIYYTLIYVSLVIIFCVARVLLPGMDQEPDRIMPAMAVFVTENVGMGWLAGLLVAAPFAAIMSTVDSFLLMISSALVRDVYQRNINPRAPERRLKWMSFAVTAVVGLAAMVGAMNPPDYLQDIIVYCGSGLAASFLIPVVLGLYWPRINSIGAVVGMLAGFASHLSLYVAGYIVHEKFTPLNLFNFSPILWGLAGSLIAAIVVTLLTAPPPEHVVRKFFCRDETAS